VYKIALHGVTCPTGASADRDGVVPTRRRQAVRLSTRSGS